MAPFRALPLGVVTLLAGMSFAQEELSTLDPESVLGEWRYQQKRLGASIDSISVYQDENRYRARLEIKILSTTSKVRIEGTWHVEGDDIKITITKSNNALLFPVGKILHKKDVEIDGAEMRYVYDGKQETEKRLEQ